MTTNVFVRSNLLNFVLLQLLSNFQKPILNFCSTKFCLQFIDTPLLLQYLSPSSILILAVFTEGGGCCVAQEGGLGGGEADGGEGRLDMGGCHKGGGELSRVLVEVATLSAQQPPENQKSSVATS